MRGRVLVDGEKDYSNWLAKQITYEKCRQKKVLKKNYWLQKTKIKY
jgi:heme/copper-type cytochrome/quinol oxidase subunit 2